VGRRSGVARRARRVFGAPGPLQWLRTRDVRIESVHDGRVRGEWIRTAGPEPGVILTSATRLNAATSESSRILTIGTPGPMPLGRRAARNV